MKVFRPTRNGKQSDTYYYDFILDGRRYQGSTRLTSRRAAEEHVDKLRAAIRNGTVGPDGKLAKRPEAPTFKTFAQRFIDSIQVRCAQKPRTVAFYAEKLEHLLRFEPLASACLDAIDEALIDSYVQERSKQKGRSGDTLAPATLNRELATLRRLLRLAYEWKVINRVPKVHLLPGERNREFILSHRQETPYLAASPQPLQDIALLDVDTGLRVSELLNLEWKNVHLEPANGARFGYIHIAGGKSRYARRNVPLTDRARAMLMEHSQHMTSPFVFPSETGQPYRVQSIDHLHAEIRDLLRLPADFVVYSFRHTYGTRLGEAGADAFTIMRLMGHSSVAVSQRYVHPTPETLERAVDRLQAMNLKALPESGKALPEAQKWLPVPEILTVDR